MTDVKNGLLGVNRDAFLKLMSVFDYKDENKLKKEKNKQNKIEEKNVKKEKNK
jgi:hypothetical protein